MPRGFKSFPYLPTIILAGLIVRLVLSGLSGWGVAGLSLCAVWWALEIARWLLPRKADPRTAGKSKTRATSKATTDREGNDALISLVYFLSEPRMVEESGIRACVASALGVRFQPGDPKSEHFVIPFSPPDTPKSERHIRHFMVRIPEGLFAVLVSDRPYIENPTEFAKESIRDKRLRSAVERHVAWISVDLMDDPGDPDQIRRAYQIIGKILGAMAGPDCLAIYCPELQRCNEFDPGLLEILGGERPLSLFEEPTFEPVIEISDKNPRMAAAVREAVSRWPEFVSAYERSTPSEQERFIVKAEFREGKKSEFMWVSVRELGVDELRGILMNDPHELMDVHRGAEVCISLDRLNDWIYPGKNGTHEGGFTLDVLADSGED